MRMRVLGLSPVRIKRSSNEVSRCSRLLGVCIFLVGMVLAAVSCASPSPADISSATASHEFFVGGMSAAERLETLQAASRTSKAPVFYLGETYQGMILHEIRTGDLGGTSSYSISLTYASDNQDGTLTLTQWTPEQWAAQRRDTLEPTGKAFPAIDGSDVFLLLGSNTGGHVQAEARRTIISFGTSLPTNPEDFFDAVRHLQLVPLDQVLLHTPTLNLVKTSALSGESVRALTGPEEQATKRQVNG